MTFVNENIRLFLDVHSVVPLRKRSEGRLKNYLSTADIRAWNYKVEDRRQQILALIRADIEKCPSRLLQEILRYFCKRNQEELAKCLVSLWTFCKTCKFAPEDKNKFTQIQRNIGEFCKQVIEGCSCAFTVGLRCRCPVRRLKEQNRKLYVPDPEKIEYPTGIYKIRSSGPVRLVTKIKGIKAGVELPSNAAIRAQCCPETKIVKILRNAYPESVPCSCTGGTEKTISVRLDKRKPFCGACCQNSPRILSNSNDTKSTTSSGTKVKFMTWPVLDQSNPRAVSQVMFDKLGLSDDDSCEIANTDSLKTELRASEWLCKKQKENIENLTTERNILNKKIQYCLKEIEGLKRSKQNQDFERISATGIPDEETLRIKEELEALKRYCLQLRGIEEENEKLKREKRILKKQLEKPYFSILPAFTQVNDTNKIKTAIKEKENFPKKMKDLHDYLLTDDTAHNPKDFEIYKGRSAMLDNTLAERDEMLKKLDSFNELQKELEYYKVKAKRIDELEDALKCNQNEKACSFELHRALSECKCFEKELKNVRLERDSLQNRLDFLTNELESFRLKAREADVLKVERDKLQIKLNSVAHVYVHNENLRLKCKTLEDSLNTSYMYKQKYEELVGLETECQVWRVQVETSELIKRERDCLKKQVIDLQTCITEQDDEIKRLTRQIDTLLKNKDDTQLRMQDAISSMRTEIEQKDSLIAASEEKLEKVQAELKSSIQGVSCETICYKTRIEELENEVNKARKEIERLEQLLQDKQYIDCKSDTNSFSALKKELEAVKVENKQLQAIAHNMVVLTGDEHVQKMLKHSECAIRKVVAELSKQYKEWDQYKQEQQHKRYGNRKVFKREGNIRFGGDLDALRKEKDLLQKNIQQLQLTNVCPGELIALKLRNNQLLEKLNSSYKKK